MFETSVVRAQTKAAERRVGLLSASIIIHASAIVAVFAASIATVGFPNTAPKQMTYLAVEPPPPPLGSPNGGPKPQAAAAPQKPRQQTAASIPRDVAPQIVPEHVAPATPGLPSDTPSVGPIGDGQKVGVPWGNPESTGPIGPASSAPPAPPDIVYRPGGNVKAPVAIRRVSPPYPAMAAKIHKNGWVILECTIDKNGAIRDAHVVKSSFGAFEQPTLDAVQQWLFAPGTLDGKPVDVMFELKVTFEMR